MRSDEAVRGKGVRHVGPGLALIVLASLAFGARVPSFAAVVPGAPDVVEGARRQIGVTRLYDPSYVRLGYPGGDVPIERGVCTDVVIRALRALGVDLQREVHEDMRAAFDHYPRMWGLRRPDRNIDHRRVPNLEVYFQRRGWGVPEGQAIQPGDVLSWRLPDGRPHIGVVSDRRGRSGEWAIIHNIGQGAREEDVATQWRRRGHFRLPRQAVPSASR